MLGAFVLVKDTDSRVGNSLFSMWKLFFLPVLQATKVAVLRPNPKKKMGVWGPMPQMTITSRYVHSRVDSNTFIIGNPMPESTLYPSQGLWIWSQHNKDSETPIWPFRKKLPLGSSVIMYKRQDPHRGHNRNTKTVVDSISLVFVENKLRRN